MIRIQGVLKEERAQGGVAIAIGSKYKKNIITWDQDRTVLQIQMELRSSILWKFMLHGDLMKKEMFYSALTRPLDKVSDGKELIIIGKLNTRIGWRVHGVGRYGEYRVNDNGERD